MLLIMVENQDDVNYKVMIVSFNCPPEMYKELGDVAKNLDRSKSWIMREAFKLYMKGQNEV